MIICYNKMTKIITISVAINKPVEKVWKLYTTPKDIMYWNNASDDWHTPSAVNDLKVGGKFVYRMESLDKNFSFDFNGIYTKINTNKLIEYTLGNNRKVKIEFTKNKDNNKTKILINFEAESENPIEMQKNGWQSILNNFKKYSENIK